MIALIKKEINAFFSSPIGYLVIGIFLILNGLFLWLFKGEFNILDNGFADLSSFFSLAPWILLILVPALCMRSFSEERKQGTLELLLTKPLSLKQIVLGKYFGVLVLLILALLPTLLYAYTVNQLSNPVGILDSGSTLGSYFGLLFLAAAYAAIGVFASTLSDNQIVAFIIAVILCFVFYIGFDGLAELTSVFAIEHIGMNSHFKSISRGVFDSRDFIYFLSIIVFFILITTEHISPNKNRRNTKRNFIYLPIALIALNVVAASFYGRYDLTEDKRYTLSTASEAIIEDIESPLIIDVFLEGENFPTEFKRLQTETKQLLDELSTRNSNIKFSFIDPIEDESTRESNIRQLSQRGLTPMQLTVQESGRSSQEVIFPWALASYGDVTVKIQLIKNKLGSTQEELVSNSVQHLEYAFADAFSKLLYPKRRKIAVLKGNGQLENRYIADFVTTLRDYYFIAPFTLDSVANNSQSTLDSLANYDLIISAKPRLAFSEKEKLVLDQYTMRGGKSLWLIDAVSMEKDSLYNAEGKSVAIPLDLNLTDFFFKYGVRLNPVLVNDLYSAPITLAAGEGSQAQFNQLPWFYSPLINTSENNHPIVNNLNLVKLDFANQIDTLKNTIKKTALLESSLLTKLDGAPKEISLSLATQEPDPKQYTAGRQLTGVLLEGEFTSVYNNRILPFQLKDYQNFSPATKMIVIADGDLIKNDIGRNGPLELGFDRWTGQTYGNKEFLLNAVNYLLDDSGLINIRSKEVALAFLDQTKVAEERTKWQLVNLILPLVLFGIFGLGFNYFRRKKYAS
ncbi:MAG: gliding motility-associated ABC transporter substrate-binding protein GldG [Flavobacteriaceae bacterium]|nr:gliding motility-associated ABC transporter substrate-binding protein GldG [Flavobacteriaceae bacterium]